MSSLEFSFVCELLDFISLRQTVFLWGWTTRVDFFPLKREIGCNFLFGVDSTVVIMQTHRVTFEFASDLCFCVDAINSAFLPMPSHSQNHNRAGVSSAWKSELICNTWTHQNSFVYPRRYLCCFEIENALQENAQVEISADEFAQRGLFHVRENW